jgi:hypothetical protein
LYELRVQHEQRPAPRRERIELAAGEQKTDFVVKSSSGAAVAGQLVDGTFPLGTEAILQRGSAEVRQLLEEQQMPFYYYGHRRRAKRVEVGTDGRFRFEGIPPDNYMLIVRLPSPAKTGGDIFVPLQPLRVRDEARDVQVSVAQDLPGTISGKFVMNGAAIPFARVMVFAQPENPERGYDYYWGGRSYWGPRVALAENGTFELRVGPGWYRMFAVDSLTGMLLHAAEKNLRVEPSEKVAVDLPTKLTQLTVRLEPEGEGQKAMACVGRIELRLTAKGTSGGFWGEDNDYGCGFDWQAGQTEVTVWVSEGSLVALARNNFRALCVETPEQPNKPVGRGEIECTGQTEPVPLPVKVGIPPEQAKKEEPAAAAKG